VIRYLNAETEAFLCNKENTFGIYEIKIYSQYQTYGAGKRELDLWSIEQDGQIRGFLSRLNGVLTIAARDVDAAECAVFAHTVGARCINGERELLEQLNAVIHGTLCASWILRRRGDIPAEAAAALCADGVSVRVERAQRLSEVCRLHVLATPGFAETVDQDAWIAEASHKQRHGLADYYILKVNKNAISTASILFRGKGQAVLAAIATHPDFRRKGYGSWLVDYTLRQACADGLAVWLFTREDSLMDFYAPLGFEIAGQWAQIDF